MVHAKTSPRSRPFFTILWIGLVAGTLDISENLIFNAFRRITPRMVFQYIASGLIGVKSFRAGMASVALGVVLHYFIALSWTAIFYAASRKLAVLTHRPAICGLLYGAFVYLFMNLVVLPLSGVPHARAAMTVASRVNGVLALLFCIGLTISLLVSRYATAKESRSPSWLEQKSHVPYWRGELRPSPAQVC